MRLFPVLAVIGAIVYTGSEAWGPSDAPAKAVQQGDFEWRGSLSQGQTLYIRGVNGPIEATLASGSEVEVRAVIHHSNGNYSWSRILLSLRRKPPTA